jgi:phenylalanyl-tRNA synthetase beta chain
MHFEPIGRSASEFAVVPPVYRPDLSREVDLIEEVARIRGMDAISVSPKMNLRVRSPQASEAARREISGLLTGQGFFETVTFSFCTRDQSAMFIPDGLQQVEVDDERRGHEPALRPSVLAGLLGCRLLNANARVVPSGGVRLFEYSSTFAQSATASRVENLALGLLMDCPVSARTPSTSDLQMGVRHLRGILHLIARSVLGTTCELTLEAAPPHCPAFRPGAFASLKADGEPLGFFGILSEAAHAAYGLEIPVVGAELSMDVLTRSFPPRTKLEALPEFPSIERDISFIVDETVSYAALEAGVRASNVTWLQGCSFVGTYRGKQIGAGRKSVTLRLQFRDASRTLRHDEVDQPAEAVVNSLKAQVGATVREG